MDIINNQYIIDFTLNINRPQIPYTNMILNIAEPTTALKPGSECEVKTPFFIF